MNRTVENVVQDSTTRTSHDFSSILPKLDVGVES